MIPTNPYVLLAILATAGVLWAGPTVKKVAVKVEQKVVHIVTLGHKGK